MPETTETIVPEVPQITLERAIYTRTGDPTADEATMQKHLTFEDIKGLKVFGKTKESTIFINPEDDSTITLLTAEVESLRRANEESRSVNSIA